MASIAIVPEPASSSDVKYRAMSGELQSLGRTPGEALDLLSSQLPEQESNTLVVVQQMKPDRFFSEVQSRRLADLMAKWRAAREATLSLPSDEQNELESLIATELEASTRRAQFVLHELKP